MPGLPFPTVGRLGRTSPPYRLSSTRLRPSVVIQPSVLCPAKTARLPSRVASPFELSLPDTWCSLPLFVSSPCSELIRRAGVNLPVPGLWHYRLGVLLPVYEPGVDRLSRVPGLPLWMRAPLSDPGGVLVARLSVDAQCVLLHGTNASRTAAFGTTATPRLSLPREQGAILVTTT